MSFITDLHAAWDRQNSLLCVGLDPEPSRFPSVLAGHPDPVFAFCKAIVDATAAHACAFKPQIAHFAALAAEDALQRLIAYIHQSHPGIPVILDAKRGDIGSTAARYAVEAFDRYQADAVTLNPYLGRDSAEPFLERADKGVILLCHTSNPGAADLQDLDVGGRPLYQHVAKIIAESWNQHGNCALVTGATWPGQLGEVRAVVGEMPLLVPGIGAQGGDVAEVIRHGCTAGGQGLMISSSRAILYAGQGEDYGLAAARAACDLKELINRQRNARGH